MSLEALVHQFCLYFRDSRTDSGWIEGIQKNKLIVVPLQGKNQFLPSNRIVFNWKAKQPPQSAEQAREILAEHLAAAEEFTNACDLETMHTLLAPEEDAQAEEYTLEDLAADFLDDPEDSLQMLGLFFALRNDHLWFRHNRNLTYTPRTPKELEVLHLQAEREQEREKRAQQVQNWISDLDAGNWDTESVNEEQQEWLEQLLSLLTDGRDSPYWKELSQLFGWGKSFGLGEEESLKRWLSQAGSPVSWSRMTLLQAKVRERFSKEVLEASDQIRSEVNQFQNEDLTEQPTFTIDSEKTQDYDDAISILEWSAGGVLVAVHITDLSDLIQTNGVVFEEAENRISSIYPLDGTIPMLPTQLADDALSLKAGKIRPVISYFFQLYQNGNWKLNEIKQQKIKIQENLCYEQADQLIEESKDFWGILDLCCQGIKQQRLEQGALNLARKEFQIDFSNPDQIKIQALNRNSGANRIVEELAILVNRETGRLFEEKEFPGIYRTQAPYELIKDLEEGEELTMDHIRVEPARLSTIPGSHAGIGCGSYMQATSPIRRFVDLITQKQLTALLSESEGLFETEDMMRWSEQVTIRQKDYNRAEREILRYWKIRYVQQNSDDFFEAKFRRKLPNNRAEIELLELACFVPATGLAEHSEGEIFLVKIVDVSLDPVRIGVSLVTENEHLTPHRISV